MPSQTPRDVTPTRSASEGVGDVVPRWRFGLVFWANDQIDAVTEVPPTRSSNATNLGSIPRFAASASNSRLPVFRIEEPPPPVGPGTEVQVPVAVVPFQRGLPPSQRNLWVRIERADVRPRRSRVLRRI